MKSHYLSQYNAFIHYQVIKGEKSTVVYLPGLSTPSMALFLTVVTHPDIIGQHSILIDYLGSGFSDQPANFDHSMQSHAETIAVVLDAENVQKCTFIGHSMGGTVGILLAKMRPDLVARLIVAEANILPGGGIGTSYIASFNQTEYVEQIFPTTLAKWRESAKFGDSTASYNLVAWQYADPVGIYRCAQALVNLDESFANIFFNLDIPRTFIYGEHSLPAYTGQSRGDTPHPELLQQNGIRVGIVPNSGHNMILDNLADFVELLKQVIQSSI